MAEARTKSTSLSAAAKAAAVEAAEREYEFRSDSPESEIKTEIDFEEQLRKLEEGDEGFTNKSNTQPRLSEELNNTHSPSSKKSPVSKPGESSKSNHKELDSRSELEKQLTDVPPPKPKTYSSPGKDLNQIEQRPSSKTTNNNNTKKSIPASPSKQPSTSLSSPTTLIKPVHPASIKPITNGSMPKSGKPMMFNMDKETKRKIMNPRGRPKVNKSVAMYHSQIKDNNVGIKLCIKKSAATAATAETGTNAKVPKTKQTRKRKSKNKTQNSDSDGETEVFEKRRRKDTKGKSNNNEQEDGVKQGPYGDRLPEHILHKIFTYAISETGALPTLARVSRVCSLWRRVAVTPSLWRIVDLSSWPRERHRTELNLKWLIENRFHGSKELNLSNWKIQNVDCVIEKLLDSAPELESLSLSGWKELTSDQLIYLVEQFDKLKKIDLSAVNAETNFGKTAVAAPSVCTACQRMGARLTHLQLNNNRLANLPQIITTLSTHCPNLELLDLSNVTTVAASHGILHIEKLQHGCQKLKVLRITNSHITLSSATLQEQMESPGFPELEELSIASLADESRIFNDECLQRILKSSTKLHLLDVRGCARLTHDSLIRLPTWDLKHLFLSGCSVTRDSSSGLELVASKYAHSLIELDLAWANIQEPLDNALKAIAEKGEESPISHLNLCGSSVSEDAVKEILSRCPALSSINLSSCRGLPRGVKRPLQGATEIKELRDTLGVTLKVPKTVNVSPTASTNP